MRRIRVRHRFWELVFTGLASNKSTNSGRIFFLRRTYAMYTISRSAPLWRRVVLLKEMVLLYFGHWSPAQQPRRTSQCLRVSVSQWYQRCLPNTSGGYVLYENDQALLQYLSLRSSVPAIVPLLASLLIEDFVHHRPCIPIDNSAFTADKPHVISPVSMYTVI